MELSKQSFIRTGFVDSTTPDSKLSALADAACTLRLLQKLKKMKISDALIHTRIPQAFGSYFKNGRACALGVLCRYSGAMNERNSHPDWDKLYKFFNCTREETSRSVWCPSCFHKNCIIAMIPHLNDKHHWKNARIGYWLRSYNL